MDTKTFYQYKANNEGSYYNLANYVVNTPATVTLHPGLLTIVISGNYTKEVGEFIDSEGLDFNINPIEVHDENLGDVIDNETTDAETLRKIIYRMMGQRTAMEEHHKSVIADMTAQRDEAQTSRDHYNKWLRESVDKYNRVKGQVQAIALLMNEIFPKE